MVICSAGIIIRNGDVEAGGDAVKVDFRRVGGMVPAKRNSHARVYEEDDGGVRTGNYKQTGQQLKVKGQEYFDAWEITGSTPEVKHLCCDVFPQRGLQTIHEGDE